MNRLVNNKRINKTCLLPHSELFFINNILNLILKIFSVPNVETCEYVLVIHLIWENILE